MQVFQQTGLILRFVHDFYPVLGLRQLRHSPQLLHIQLLLIRADFDTFLFLSLRLYLRLCGLSEFGGLEELDAFSGKHRVQVLPPYFFAE